MSTLESTTTIAPAGTTWAADPVHSDVAFEVEYAGVSIFRGSFRDFDATLEGSAPRRRRRRVASVDVKDEQLAGHLQSPDFFDAERHPEISFRADELTLADGGTVAGSGELTIKGVTKPVRAAAAVFGRAERRPVRPRAPRPRARDRDRPQRVRRRAGTHRTRAAATTSATRSR